jgi:hypothetical protein
MKAFYYISNRIEDFTICLNAWKFEEPLKGPMVKKLEEPVTKNLRCGSEPSILWTRNH